MSDCQHLQEILTNMKVVNCVTYFTPSEFRFNLVKNIRGISNSRNCFCSQARLVAQQYSGVMYIVHTTQVQSLRFTCFPRVIDCNQT